MEMEPCIHEHLDRLDDEADYGKGKNLPPYRTARPRMSTVLYLTVVVDINKHAPYFHRAKYEAARRAFCLVPTPRRTLLCSLSSAICRFIYRFLHKA